MANIFTIEDIKDFLKEQGSLEWTGYIYKDNGYDRKLATIEDFVYPQKSTVALEIINRNARNTFVDMFITNFNFLTYTDISQFVDNGSFPSVDKSWSKKWHQFLLNRYKEKYAKLLFDWSIDNITGIQCGTQKNIEDYTRKEKANADRKIAIFNEIAKNAMNHLSSEDIQAIEGTINL